MRTNITPHHTLRSFGASERYIPPGAAYFKLALRRVSGDGLHERGSHTTRQVGSGVVRRVWRKWMDEAWWGFRCLVVVVVGEWAVVEVELGALLAAKPLPG